ncbi:MAG: PQQ-binding-like beta-propeller repeat protein [Pirellula sp.]|nr:PQQ-binding-like beta-propeller repeat protein [Pirellula sp.]
MQRFFGLLLGFFATSIHVVQAEDWPHWMGPNRDNVWTVSNPPTSFPSSGLKPRWQTAVAGGYAGPAVVGSKVYVTDFVSDSNVKVDNFGRRSFSGSERVLCIDDTDGKVVWKVEYPVTYTISYPAGPRCTPIVDGDRLFTLGAEGDLYCLNASTGTVLWSKNLKKAYNTDSPLWGYAGHPLVVGNLLYTLAGGNGSHIVCLNKNTGEEVWRSGTGKEQGYVPPSIIQAGGTKQLIAPSASAITSVDPATGKEYWSFPYEASNGSIIMTPVTSGPYLFIGGYSRKNLLLKLNDQKPTATKVWQDVAKKAISPVNVQPMVIDGIVYGFDETGELLAFEIESGKRLWETSKPVSPRPVQSGTAFIVRTEKNFILFNDSGELILANLSPSGYEEIARTKIIEPTNNAFGRDVVWCAPAFANGSIYVRNDEKLLCIPLVATASK